MSQYSFNAVSTVHKRRSFFDLSRSVTTSMNVGTLYPIQCREVLPGDTFKEHEGHVVRLSSTFIRPVFDNAYMDVYNFFVPSRLVYDKFKNVMGENTETAWSNSKEYNVPFFSDLSFTEVISIGSKTVGDYLNLPVGNIPSNISVLPFRAFALVYDEWFRNENTVDPMFIQKGETAQSEKPNTNPWSPNNYTGQLPKVAKKKDYFTSALPSPQKGSPVNVSVGGLAPLKVGDYVDVGGQIRIGPDSGLSYPQAYQPILSMVNNEHELGTLGYAVSQGIVGANTINDAVSMTNLHADLSSAQGTSINDIRQAFQVQRMLELDARGGTRYREYLLSHFGVDNADARMQVSEFLGGKRTPLNVQQVAQTAQSADSEALGTLGAYSYSVGKSGYVKSFSEHGYVLTVACIRYQHTYQQGIEKMWSRRSRNDYYDPLFAYLGEQPIYSAQLYGVASNDFKKDIYGYNEAWAEYRYAPSYITGQMRSGVKNSLDVYHFGDYYQNAPVLGQEFTDETPTFFDRSIAVPSSSMDNFVVQFYFNTKAWHVMPTFSTPGLIDHTY